MIGRAQNGTKLSKHRQLPVQPSYLGLAVDAHAKRPMRSKIRAYVRPLGAFGSVPGLKGR